MKSHFLKITITFVCSDLTHLVSLKYFYLNNAQIASWNGNERGRHGWLARKTKLTIVTKETKETMMTRLTIRLTTVIEPGDYGEEDDYAEWDGSKRLEWLALLG